MYYSLKSSKLYADSFITFVIIIYVEKTEELYPWTSECESEYTYYCVQHDKCVVVNYPAIKKLWGTYS